MKQKEGKSKKVKGKSVDTPCRRELKIKNKG